MLLGGRKVETTALLGEKEVDGGGLLDWRRLLLGRSGTTDRWAAGREWRCWVGESGTAG
jgi:hypothetical protein